MSHWDVCVALALESPDLYDHKLVAAHYTWHSDIELVKSGTNQSGETRLRGNAADLYRHWRGQRCWLTDKFCGRRRWVRTPKSGAEQQNDLAWAGRPAG